MHKIKLTKAVFLLTLLTGTMSCDVAWAGRWHAHHGIHVGIYLGGPAFLPWYYPAPYYGSTYYRSNYYGPAYYAPSHYSSTDYGPTYTYGNPTIVTAPAPVPVYIEQRNATSPSQNPNYWYYCNNPDGYYPYIKDCNSGWQQVAPRASTSQ